MAAVLQYRHRREQACAQALDVGDELLNWSSTGALCSVMAYEVAGETRNVLVVPAQSADPTVADMYTLQVGSSQIEVAVRPGDDPALPIARLSVDGQGTRAVYHHQDERTVYIAREAHSYCFTDVSGGESDAAESAGSGRIVAPMHGQLLV